MPTVREILGDEFATLQGQGKTNDQIIAIAKERYKNPPQIETPQQPIQKDSVPKWYKGETDNGLINFGADVLRGAGKTGLNYLNALEDGLGVDNSKTTKILQKLDKITEDHKAKNRTPARKEEVQKLNEAYQNAGSYGKRVDGTEKGTGWLGELKMKDGSNRVMTELSLGFDVNGKEVEMPSIVPTLTDAEVNYLLEGNKPTREIMQKAFHHGMDRIKNGKSPFINDGMSNIDAFGEKFNAGLNSVKDTLLHPSEWQVGEFVGENLDPINAIPVGKGIVAGATIGGLTNGIQAGGFAQARDDKSTMDAVVEGALGATAGVVLGGATGGLTKKANVPSTKGSDYEAAYSGLGVDEEPKKYPREAYYRDRRNPDKVDEKGMLTDPFDQIVQKEVYNKFATVVQQEEQSVIDVDIIVKQISHDMAAKGATPEQIETEISKQLLPSPESLKITAVLNDGKPVTPRLSGLNLQQATLCLN